MSRSYRKPIYKDKGIGKKLYNRTIRRVQKQAYKQSKDIPNSKVIINDYTYCDYKWDFRFDTSNFWNSSKLKLSRK